MIENTFVKKVVQGILRNRKQSILDRSIMHPYREWFIGLLAALCVVGVSTVWGVSTYLEFSNVSVGGESTPEENLVYRESLVETALDDFTKRRQDYENLKQDLLTVQKPVEVAPLPPVVSSEATTTEAVIVEEEAVIESNEPVTDAPTEAVISL